MTENAYLVGLRLAGKKVVVVGGGTVAQRRLPLLIANGADVHVVTRSATPAVPLSGTLGEPLDHEFGGSKLRYALCEKQRTNGASTTGHEIRDLS